MQQLTRLLRRLRREDGATAVLVAILMVPILGVAAISLDAGSLYFEKAQLQNGADAAALGIAARCAKALPTCSSTAYGADVTDVANKNQRTDPNDPALTGAEAISAVTFPTSTSVTATTRTSTADGSNGVQHPFLSAMSALLGSPDLAPTVVTASGTATWAAPSSATNVLPLAFSLCGLNAALAGGTKILLRSDQNNGSSSCSAADGHPISGGFGWLAGTACSASMSIGDLVASDQGNDLPSRCSSLINPESLIGTTVEVPIFDCAANSAGTCLTQVGNHTGTQKVASYRIYGFAAFLIAGHRLTGGDSATSPLWTGQLSCNGNCRGIQGTFVRWSFTGPIGAPGPSLGAYSVRLTH